MSDEPVLLTSILTSDTKPDQVYFNWPRIKEQAARPLRRPNPAAPGMNNMGSAEYRMFEAEFNSIMRCRDLLAARHAGWVESGTTNENPFPPERMRHPDDMKAS